MGHLSYLLRRGPRKSARAGLWMPLPLWGLWLPRVTTSTRPVREFVLALGMKFQAQDGRRLPRIPSEVLRRRFGHPGESVLFSREQ